MSVSIKIALLTLGGLATTALLRRHSAAMRHWVLATTLFACLCVPAAEIALPRWSISVPDNWLTPGTITSSLRLTSNAPAVRIDADDSRATTEGVVPETSMLSPAALLVTIWIAGALAGFAALGVGLLRLRNLAARSEAVLTGTWRAAADEISAQYGIRRRVRIFRCPHPTLLATWGLVRPTILLPQGAETWADERVRVVLRHELAHIARADWAVALAANVTRAAYWFNPLLWIACRRLRHEGERACDDLVLASGIGAADYATHLLDVAREASSRREIWSPAIAIAHHSMLEGRVRAMLNAHLNRTPMTILVRATTVAATALVALTVGVVSLSGSTTAVVTPAAQPAAARADAPAQTPARGGTIEGVLYDQFGGLLPGASVRLTQIASGSSQTSSTNRSGAFSFGGLATGNYELVTDLPGFTSVTVVVHAEPGQTVRRHITLPIGSLEETIHVVCNPASLTPSRPSAPAGAATPGGAQRQTTAASGAEPKIPATFSGGIGGQIKVPRKVSHSNPTCPTGVTPEPTTVRLVGRIGIDGLFTDLHEVSSVSGPYAASALDATRQWAFTPTLLNGAPVEVNMTVTVIYRWSN
jgi:beta-lactamase regulating signal transducer with metallopeptidase domain